jgi:adenine deaminase
MSLINTWLQKKLTNARPGLLTALEGNVPCDWCISGGNVLDVFTLTIYPADVWLKDGFIVLLMLNLPFLRQAYKVCQELGA